MNRELFYGVKEILHAGERHEFIWQTSSMLLHQVQVKAGSSCLAQAAPSWDSSPIDHRSPGQYEARRSVRNYGWENRQRFSWIPSAVEMPPRGKSPRGSATAGVDSFACRAPLQVWRSSSSSHWEFALRTAGPASTGMIGQRCSHPLPKQFLGGRPRVALNSPRREARDKLCGAAGRRPCTGLR